jgi:Methyltransferase domain
MSVTQPIIICRACKNLSAVFLMDGQIFKDNIKYYECSHCLYVQTETPYWLDKAYTSAISSSDTGILRRNQANAKIALSTLLLLGEMNDRLVDCAGGYGILVRLLRDYGVDAYWTDEYCENLLAKGFEYENGAASLVTAFEAFEHFVNPLDELESLLQIAPNILLSTEIISSPAPTQQNWWYYGKEHGQHIGFFRIRTLEVMASRFGKKIISDGKSYHLITSHNISGTYWKALCLLTRFFPWIPTWKLKSKTWADHHKITKQNE